MPELSYRTSCGPTKMQDVESFERVLGSRLPDEYRNFLLAKNGGWPDSDLMFPISDAPFDEHGILNCLFGLFDENEMYDLREEFETYLGRIPANLVPIGEDPGGNLICLATSGVDRGMIYYWDHEQESEEAGYENVYLVSTGFTAFLDGLENFPDD
jgi:hypothetical protein